MKILKEKLLYAIGAPVFAAIIVYLIQFVIESDQPILSIKVDEGIIKVTNNTSEALKVRVYYIYKLPNNEEEVCTSPDIRISQEDGFPTQILVGDETREFSIGACPSDPDAVFVRYGVRAWNLENETVFLIDH